MDGIKDLSPRPNKKNKKKGIGEESHKSPVARLYAAYYAQDDPKKNTVKRLAKFGLVELRKSIHQCPRSAIVLDPFSPKELSIKDRERIIKSGLVVIDCSWNKIDTIFKSPFKNGRRLPPLVAANPINYGKWNKLSSAEALAAALYLVDLPLQASELLSRFSWGPEFIKINRENLNLKEISN